GAAWTPTAGSTLGRSPGRPFLRTAAVHLDQAERPYAPYRVTAGGGSIACAFRDHVLSDLIGFTYAGWSADRAADDFVARLVEAGRRVPERSGGGDAFVPVVLDGEDAWGHYEGGGAPLPRAPFAPPPLPP